MKKIFVTCAMLAVASVASFAQKATQTAAPATGTPQQAHAHPQMTPEQMQDRQNKMADRQAQAFQKQYGLNNEQYAGVHEACLNFAKNIESMRAQGKQPGKEQMEKIFAERDASLKKAMSAEQYAKYESTLANHPGVNAQQNGVKK